MHNDGQERYGRFKVSGEIIENNPELVFEMFTKLEFLPIRIIPSDDFKYLEYQGVSRSFKEIGLGDPIPEYVIEISSNIAGYEFLAKGATLQ